VQPKSLLANVNGLQLQYLDWGNVGAPPVVCVHGYTSSAQAFNAPAGTSRIAFTSSRRRAGSRESAWSPAGAYEYRDQVSDLAALVDHLGLARFTLIGTSMGGIIAMAYAEAHADRLARLVINDIGPDVENGSGRITQMVASRPEDFATLERREWRTAARCLPSPPAAASTISGSSRWACSSNGADGRWVWKMDPAYIQQRVQRGARRGPRSGPCSSGCLPHTGGVGNGERRPLGGSGPSHGGRAPSR